MFHILFLLFDEIFVVAHTLADALDHFVDAVREHGKFRVSALVDGDVKVSAGNFAHVMGDAVDALHDFVIHHAVDHKKQCAENDQHTQGYHEGLAGAAGIVFAGGHEGSDNLILVFLCHVVAAHAVYDGFSLSCEC